jgi:hypothetical protein
LKAGHGKLVRLDIEGEWNKPLLLNAAALSGWECCFAQSHLIRPGPAAPASYGSLETVDLDNILVACPHVIACEISRNSVSLYDFPAPRGATAVIVGNEETGIPRGVLKQADQVVSIPMVQGRLSSLNVAAAARFRHSGSILLSVLSQLLRA